MLSGGFPSQRRPCNADRQNFLFHKLEQATIDSRYIMVIYGTIAHTGQQLQWYNFGQICTHERHPIPCPYGEVWGVFHELYEEKWPRHIKSAQYWTKSRVVSGFRHLDTHVTSPYWGLSSTDGTFFTHERQVDRTCTFLRLNIIY